MSKRGRGWIHHNEINSNEFKKTTGWPPALPKKDVAWLDIWFLTFRANRVVSSCKLIKAQEQLNLVTTECYHYVVSKRRGRNTQRSSVKNQKNCFLITYFCLIEAKWAAFVLGSRKDRGCNLNPDIRHTGWRLPSFLPVPPRKCPASTSHYVTPRSIYTLPN